VGAYASSVSNLASPLAAGDRADAVPGLILGQVEHGVLASEPKHGTTVVAGQAEHDAPRAAAGSV
jgi:hypothetical protein